MGLNNNRRPTIFDVVALAGVSKSTVSRVVQDDVRVAEHTRKKVQEAIDALGYVPFAAAQNLRGTAPATIGLLISPLDIPIFGVTQHELNIRFQELGFHLVQATVMNRSLKHQKDLINQMRRINVQGLIVACGIFDTDLLVETAKTLPVVSLGSPEENDLLSNIYYDEVKHGVMLSDHLYGLGHRNIVIQTMHHKQSRGSAVRSQSAIVRAQELGMAVSLATLPAVEDYQSWMKSVLDSKNTAIMCLYDRQLIYAWRSLIALGASAPQDMSLTGSDGISGAVDLLGLTTIRKPVEEAAVRVADLLIDMIENGVREKDPVKECFTGTLIVGTTTAKNSVF